jgi:hypothetical protein
LSVLPWAGLLNASEKGGEFSRRVPIVKFAQHLSYRV